MPQQEPRYPRQGLSCDQGKYYLALLMFNAPPHLWPPHSQALSPKQRQREEGSGTCPVCGGTWQDCRQMTVSVRVRVCVCVRVKH